MKVTSPVAGAEVSGAISVSVSYSIDGGQVHSLTLSAAGAEVESIDPNRRSGTHVFSLNTADYPNGPLELAVEACSADEHSGHCSTDRVTVNVNNTPTDTESPVIEITDPSPGEMLAAKPVAVAADLSDDVAVNQSTVVVKLDGANVTSQCTVTAVSVSCSLSPADGLHSLTVDCKDTSNKSAVQESVNFNVDTVAPSVAISSHTDGQTVNTAAINLAGAVGDATSGVASVEVNGTAAVVNGGNWTLNNFTLEEGVKRRRILTPKPRRKLTPLEGRLIEALSTG